MNGRMNQFHEKVPRNGRAENSPMRRMNLYTTQLAQNSEIFLPTVWYIDTFKQKSPGIRVFNGDFEQ